MRIGIDLGGTKTEIIALDRSDGREIYRKRIPTARQDYDSVVRSLAGLAHEAETALGRTGTVGVGIPGAISFRTGLIKNANLQILNGHKLDADLGAALGRVVRCSNDANCLAVSEAVDGAAAGCAVVFAAILGTGCGSGIALNGKVWDGLNRVAGEWGHNPLPWMTAAEYPGPPCWCGLKGCQELYLSGTGFETDYQAHAQKKLSGSDIVEQMRQGAPEAQACFDRYVDRLARALTNIINILDPDAIVLGGGMSNVDELYTRLPAVLPAFVFGGEAATPVLKNKHGDSSGVRGAAWLFSEARL